MTPADDLLDALKDLDALIGEQEDGTFPEEDGALHDEGGPDQEELF